MLESVREIHGHSSVSQLCDRARYRYSSPEQVFSELLKLTKNRDIFYPENLLRDSSKVGQLAKSERQVVQQSVYVCHGPNVGEILLYMYD